MSRSKRPDTIEALRKRRDSWAKEIGGNNEWSHLAPQFVRELEAEIADRLTRSKSTPDILRSDD